jgi:hypothetical protein
MACEPAYTAKVVALVAMIAFWASGTVAGSEPEGRRVVE